MFKCYLTGIELQQDEAYTLDLGAARKAIKKLKDKVFALERLAEELGHIDKVEIRNKKGKRIIQRRRRLVSCHLAEAFSKDYSEEKLFIKWHEWIAKMKSNDSKRVTSISSSTNNISSI